MKILEHARRFNHTYDGLLVLSKNGNLVKVRDPVILAMEQVCLCAFRTIDTHPHDPLLSDLYRHTEHLRHIAKTQEE